MSGWVLLLYVLLFLEIGFFIWLLVRDRKKSKTWHYVADGEFDRVEYGHWTESRRSGSMVHTTSHYRMTATAVFFSDGRSFILDGRHDMPFPKGTRLVIRENGNGRRRIKQAPS